MLARTVEVFLWLAIGEIAMERINKTSNNIRSSVNASLVNIVACVGISARSPGGNPNIVDETVSQSQN